MYRMAIYYLFHVSGLLPVRDLDICERGEAVLESVTSITGRVPVMCNVYCIGLCNAENEEQRKITNGEGEAMRGSALSSPGSLNPTVRFINFCQF